ncbi:hypothetical protein P8452_04658 [Trifolium repens]|nr:hypothetical protein P8452_04658 [Trifolium repens]
MDLSGLLLLYSSLGDAEGISKLATLAEEQGKNNIAFLCLFMLGKLEDCLQLLVESNRIPEAALMARSYLPSKVSEIVAIWRKDLSKVNPKAAESLADPEEYPKAAETRVFTILQRSTLTTLIEEGDQPLENGDYNHELIEQNGDEDYTEEHEEQNGEDYTDEQVEQNGEEGSQEDSTDGAVLVNGNEADEELSTDKGAPSA